MPVYIVDCHMWFGPPHSVVDMQASMWWYVYLSVKEDVRSVVVAAMHTSSGICKEMDP